MTVRCPSSFRFRLAVFVGGAVGTALRYSTYQMWSPDVGDFPVTTLTINVVGAFGLGCFVAMVPSDAAVFHGFVRVGVLGGFTTFSTYTVELARFLRDGRVAVCVLYATTMTFVGIAATTAGLRCGRPVPRRVA
jgi:CrcB protein